MRSSLAAILLTGLLAGVVWSWARHRARAHQAGPPAAPAATALAPAPGDAAPEDPGFLGVVLAGETLELEPKIEGRVLSIAVSPGDEVTAGAEVATLHLGTMKQELTMARVELARATRRLARRVPALSGGLGAVSEEELDDARLEAAVQRAKVARLVEVLREAHIVAPLDGTVATVYVTAGALAGPGRPVMRLNGRGDPKVRFAAPEALPRPLTPGTRVTVRLPPRGLETVATVVTVAPEVDVSSRMVYVTAALPRHPALKALATGLLARVFLREP